MLEIRLELFPFNRPLVLVFFQLLLQLVIFLFQCCHILAVLRSDLETGSIHLFFKSIDPLFIRVDCLVGLLKNVFQSEAYSV